MPLELDTKSHATVWYNGCVIVVKRRYDDSNIHWTWCGGRLGGGGAYDKTSWYSADAALLDACLWAQGESTWGPYTVRVRHWGDAGVVDKPRMPLA